jgi:endonuclease YncB( thermonuclease family)
MHLFSRSLLAALSLILVAAAPKAKEKAPAKPAAEDPAAPPKGILGKADACTILRVVDGDTADVMVKGKEERLRLLDMDTEESWPSASKPVTPFGLETSKWAKSFLASEEPCWIEYGDEKRDVYDRLLAYLWRKQDGKWQMYNLQAIEKGYSPYFTKYGYAPKHHDAFLAAEKRAQEAKKGIWDPSNEMDLRGKYLGPDGLRVWWDKRAEQLKAWNAISKYREDIIDMRENFRFAKAQAGTRIHAFTAIRQAGQDGSTWVGKCEGRLFEPLEIVAAGGNSAVEEALRGTIGHYRYFTGVVSLADDNKTLRITIESPSDVSITAPPKPGAKKAQAPR